MALADEPPGAGDGIETAASLLARLWVYARDPKSSDHARALEILRGLGCAAEVAELLADQLADQLAAAKRGEAELADLDSDNIH